MQAVVSLLILSTLVFFLARASGDPMSLLVAESATPQMVQDVRQLYGFDKPLYVQYAKFMTNASKGDFGMSIYKRRPVISMIFEPLVNSAKLDAVAVLISLITAIPLGFLAAVKRNSVGDWLARFFAGLGQSVPAFWLGLMLIIFFGVQLRWLPVSDIGDWKHYVLPAFTISVFMSAAVIRLLRSTC